MKQINFKIISNRQIAPGVFEIILEGDTTEIMSPGQFVNIKLDGFFLRRPISVCDRDNNTLTLIYKVVGEGTEKLSQMKENDILDILIALGNGFNTEVCGESPLLVGGGVGIPPMYLLCKTLIKAGKKVQVILGFNKKSEIFYEEKFKSLGADVTVTTVDGSYGIKGFVTDAMKDIDYSYFYACGPIPMLKAVSDCSATSGQLSFEERMACGFGACVGCTCKTKYGAKRICKDGPVLKKEEVLW